MHTRTVCNRKVRKQSSSTQETIYGRMLHQIVKPFSSVLHIKQNDDYTERLTDNSCSSIEDIIHTSDLQLKVTGFSVGADGVVMYHVDVCDSQQPSPTYTIRRRYNDFSNLHGELSKLMMPKQLLHCPRLPDLPSAGFFSLIRRHETSLLERRTKIFQDILDAVVQHPQARESEIFLEFLSFDPSTIFHRGSSYVSLRDYSVPCIDINRESIKRNFPANI